MYDPDLLETVTFVCISSLSIAVRLWSFVAAWKMWMFEKICWSSELQGPCDFRDHRILGGIVGLAVKISFIYLPRCIWVLTAGQKSCFCVKRNWLQVGRMMCGTTNAYIAKICSVTKLNLQASDKVKPVSLRKMFHPEQYLFDLAGD